MLVLSRKPGQRIMMSDGTILTFVGWDGAKGKIGIDAPRERRILREELVTIGGPCSLLEPLNQPKERKAS